MTARNRDTGHRHDGALELATRGPAATAQDGGARPAPAQLSNGARAAMAARDRAGEERIADDLRRLFTGGGLPPLPPPCLGGDPAGTPGTGRELAALAALDALDGPARPIPVTVITPGASVRRAPPLPAPPDPC